MVEIKSVNQNLVEYALVGDYEMQFENQLTIINADTGETIFNERIISFSLNHEIPKDVIKKSGNYIFKIRSFPDGGCDFKKQYIEVVNYKVGDIVRISKEVTVKEQGQELVSVCLLVAIGKILDLTDKVITLDCSKQFNSVIKTFELNSKYNIIKIPENLVIISL